MSALKGIPRGRVRIDLLFSLIGLAVLVGAVIVIIRFTIPFASESIASRNWPVTTGTIVQNELRTRVSGGERTSSLHVGYLYTVDGIELLGTRVKIDESFEKDARISSRYPVGKGVQVHYDPDRPWRAVLEPGWVFGLTIFFPLIMLILGGLFTFLPLLASRKQAPEETAVEAMASRGNRLMGVLFMGMGGVIVVFGIVMGFLVMTILEDGGPSRQDIASWNTVPARITGSGFEEVTEQQSVSWQGRITYEYEVNGASHLGTRYARKAGGDLNPPSEAIHAHRPGDTVMVRVNPRNDAEAYLTSEPVESGFDRDFFMLLPTCMLASGLVFACVGLILILRA